METNNQEQVIEKIKKLLALSEKNSNDNEAKAAALKAQKLMNQYDISIDTIGTAPEETIDYDTLYVGNGKSWKYALANIISTNFKCKNFWVGSKTVAFYGYKQNTEVSKITFNWLFKMIHRLADREVHRGYAKGIDVSNIYKSYVSGFLTGLKTSLEAQSKALLIITPTKVTDSYQEFSKDFKTRNKSIKVNSINEDSYKAGVEDGRNCMGKRELECSSC